MVSVASPLLLLLVALASAGARDLYQMQQQAGADESYDSAADGGDENYVLTADSSDQPVGTGRQIGLGSILTTLGTAGLSGLLTPLLGQTLSGLFGSGLGSGLLGILTSGLGLARQPLPLTLPEQDLSSVLATRLAQKPITSPANNHLAGNEYDDEEHTLHYDAFLIQVPGLGPCIVLAPQQHTSGGHHSDQALAMPLGPVSLKPFQSQHPQDFHEHEADLDHQAPAPPHKKPAAALNLRPIAARLDNMREAYHR